MALQRKVDDAGDEDDKEQGEPTAKRSKGPGKGGPKGARPKGPCWHCGGPHLQRDCPHINDEGKEKAWSTSGASRSWRPGPFPEPTVQEWNSWFPKPPLPPPSPHPHPEAKVKESQEKEAKAKVEKANGLGPKLECWIHILDGKAHLWDTFTQMGAPT